MSEWIKCRKSLPPYDTDVLVYYPNECTGEIRVSVLYQEGWQLEKVFGKPSHWMPLPDKPEEEK